MNPVLIIATSHGELGSSGRKTGLWLEEFVAIYSRFRHAGITVTVATPRGGAVPIDPLSLKVPALSAEARRFIAYGDPALSRTVPLRLIGANDFDAVFYPGGHGPMWDLATDLVNARILGAFFACGKAVGAVCHGPAALLKARKRNGYPVIHQRRVTGFSDAEERQSGLTETVPFSLEERMKNAGGVYSHSEPWVRHVVVDGNLVTGQNPQSSADVAEAMLDLLKPAQIVLRRRLIQA